MRIGPAGGAQEHLHHEQPHRPAHLTGLQLFPLILSFILSTASANMLAALVSGLAVVALGTVGVNAGSRAWESKIKYARAVHHETLQARDVALETYGNASEVIRSRSTGAPDSALPNAQYHFHNGSSRSVHKRWIGVNPGTDPRENLWHQGNIYVCFEQAMWGSRMTEEILRGPLEEARNLWRDKGLDDSNGWFGWHVVDNKEWCSNRENRPNFLLVMYAGPNIANMATTAGKGPSGTRITRMPRTSHSAPR